MKNLLYGLLLTVSLAFTASAAPPPDQADHLPELLQVDTSPHAFLEAQSGPILLSVPEHPIFVVHLEPLAPFEVTEIGAGYPSGLTVVSTPIFAQTKPFKRTRYSWFPLRFEYGLARTFSPPSGPDIPENCPAGILFSHPQPPSGHEH